MEKWRLDLERYSAEKPPPDLSREAGEAIRSTFARSRLSTVSPPSPASEARKGWGGGTQPFKFNDVDH
jgi:hypothetical protein